MATYSVVPINDIVQLDVEGALDFDETRRLILDIATGAETAGRDLLVDLRKTDAVLSFQDVHRLVEVFAEHPGAFRGRLALLDEYDTMLEKTQFFEFSATERGFEVRTFLNERDAVDWLERSA